MEIAAWHGWARHLRAGRLFGWVAAALLTAVTAHAQTPAPVQDAAASGAVPATAEAGASAAEPGASAPVAMPSPPSLHNCAARVRAAQRLACFDALAAQAAASTQPPQSGGAQNADANPSFQGLQAPGWMTRDWELDAAHKRGTFRFFTHQANFLLPAHYSTATNSAPHSPTPDHNAQLPEYRNWETKLQISLRTKLAQDLLLPQADLWFGYTQVSLWQLWSSSLSAPFRSTDYEPELIYVVPVPERYSVVSPQWRWRFWQLALAHQSNGQAIPLSRSWNRVYLAAGLERGPITATVRAWRRVPEELSDDDNPDLTIYRGRGDLALVWDMDLARVGFNWRTNFRDLNRGAVELNWTYPVGGSRTDGLRWYVQAFHGYGESLLDYNFSQTSIGLGVTLFNF